jgi:hypothetical protein
MALVVHWLRPDNTTQYLCRSNLAASCDCYVALSINQIAPVESDHHRCVAYFFACPVGTLCLTRAKIAPVAHVAWIYRVP